MEDQFLNSQQHQVLIKKFTKARAKRKKKEHAATKLADKTTTNEIKVGIVHETTPLTNEEILELRRRTVKYICKQKDSSLKPKFTRNISLRPGWFIFYCSNEETAEWLKSLELWNFYGCKPIDEKDFPDYFKVIGHFPNSSDIDTTTILETIEHENQGLKTTNWKVLFRKVNDAIVTLNIEIDKNSDDHLRRVQYKINYRNKNSIRLKAKYKT